MPMRTPPEASPIGRVVFVLASLLVLFGLGCLNLDLPTVPATPPAPSLTVVTPKPGDTIGLSTQVSVQASSVYGISTVSLFCGPPDAGARTVYIWTVAPYGAVVDFAPCEGLAVPNPDAGNSEDGGYPLLQLQVVATSDAGVPQEQDLQVFFNTVGPVLTVQYPPSAQPKAPFTVQVTSDTPLRSFPQVTLASQPPTSITVSQDAGGPPTYNAYFQSAPGIGTDSPDSVYTPGVPVSFEALTDTDTTVRLTVSATAVNGNGTQLDLGVDLTRVVWNRYIPGSPASSSPISWAAEPVACDAGLVLPLATALPADSTSAWIPGLLTLADGTFAGFQVSQLPGGLDGGYVARGLNAQGQSLFFNFTDAGSNLLLAGPPGSTWPAITSNSGPPTANAPLSQVDDYVCLQDSAAACSGVPTTEGLTCFDPQLNVVTVSSGPVMTGPPSPGIVAGAGGRYLSPNVGVCGSSWNLVDLTQGSVSFGPTDLPPGCAVQGISKLLAVGDGTFVVQLTSDCGAAAPLLVYPIVRVGPGSSILGSYLAPLDSPSRTQAEVVGVLADGRVVTVTNTPPYTTFQLWSPGSTTPDVVSPIAGLYDTSDALQSSVLAQSVYAGADGSFAVLLSGATLGVGVLAFAPDLQPHWLYVYPRTTETTTTRLVSAASFPQVYLVDELNQYAVSLQVVGPVPGGAIDAGPDGGVALRAVSGVVETVYQLPGQPKTVIPTDFTAGNVSALALDGGAYGPAIVGTGFNNGTFTVEGIPTAGDYLLDLAGTYYWFPDGLLTATTLGAGRSDVVSFNYSLPSDATLTLNLTNLAAWNANDEIEVLSLGANDFVNVAPFGCNPAPTPAGGATTLAGSVFSVKQCGGPNVIDAAKGDTVIISQVAAQQTSTGSFYLSLARYYQPAPFSLSDGQNVTVVGAAAAVTQNQTLNCDFRLSQFAAALAGLEPSGFTSAGILYGINVIGGSIPASEGLPLQGTADYLAYSPAPNNVDAVSGPMTYGLPAAYPFSPYGFVSYNSLEQFAFPGTTPNNQEVRGVQEAVDLNTLCTGPVVPILTPPRALTLNGAAASQPLAGVGLTPLVAWTAPAQGTPSRYHVILYSFFKSGNGLNTLNAVVAQILTRDLQVRIPPGLLTAGSTYNIQVVADDTVPIGAGYLVLGESSSSAITSVFTP